MIPERIIVTGDIPRGRELIGLAKGQMGILARQMGFQHLTEGFRTVSPFPGVVIECWRTNILNDMRDIRIHVEPKQKGGEEVTVKKTRERRECFCFPHISLARIIAVHPDILPIPKQSDYASFEAYTEAVAAQAASVIEYNNFLPTCFSFTYDIEICAKTSYVLFNGAYDPNFGRYYAGQIVLVSVGYSIEDEMDRWESFPATYSYPCDRTCLISDPLFHNLIIIPVHIVNDKDEPLMDKWYLEKTYDIS